MNRFRVLFLIILSFLCLPLYTASAEEVLSWGDCLTEAKENHPDLIYAQEEVNQQKAARAITASGLFPQIDADAAISRKRTETESSVTGKTTGVTTDSYSYGVSGGQLIFDGFKTVNDVGAASENIKASQHGYRFTSSEVRLALRSAFVNLLKAQELIRVAEEIAKIRKDNLDLLTLRYQSGLEHKGALLTAEANLAEAGFELSQAKRDVELAQRQLTKEMGRKEFKPMYIKGDFTVRDTAKEKPDLEALAENSPSLLQLIARKDAAAFEVKSAYANFSPKISAQAGADKSSSDWPPQNEQWDAGLSLSMPIFEGGLRLAQVSQAKAAYRQAEASERSTKDSIVVNLEKTWTALQDAVETVEVQRKSLEAAQERSRIAQAQYSTGFITFDNWIIIENDLVGAKKAYLQAQTNALLTEAGWIQAKGEVLEYAE